MLDIRQKVFNRIKLLHVSIEDIAISVNFGLFPIKLLKIWGNTRQRILKQFGNTVANVLSMPGLGISYIPYLFTLIIPIQ